MPENQSRVLSVVFVLLAVFLLINGFISLRNISALSENDRWVTHTFEVMAKLDDVSSTVKDAETGARGFMLTGNEAYLETGPEVGSQIDDDLKNLSELTSDNPEERRRIEELGPLIHSRLDRLQEAIARRRALGAAALQVPSFGAGKELMDQIRAIAAQMESGERTLLAVRRAEAARSRRIATLTFVFATIIAMLLLAAAYRLLHRNMEERRRLGEAIREQKEWLEVTLAGIGDAVIATDTRGKITFVNPVAEALTGWPAAEALGQEIEKVFHIVNEYSKQPVESPVSRVLREGSVVGLANHTVLIGRDGEEIAI
ncbi:MAG TPA: CHASE3 domain-containing protein, partial [Blastocatellia bacterium]|nr:CHASE3 domain-containing protein [Blastocatellia bacterium]